jgi:hypothetical protein
LVSSQAQTIQLKLEFADGKREFKNQGEQGDSWALQFFEKIIQSESFKKYDSVIVAKCRYREVCGQIFFGLGSRQI